LTLRRPTRIIGVEFTIWLINEDFPRVPMIIGSEEGGGLDAKIFETVGFMPVSQCMSVAKS
jgi:hypothetical protein